MSRPTQVAIAAAAVLVVAIAGYSLMPRSTSSGGPASAAPSPTPTPVVTPSLTPAPTVLSTPTLAAPGMLPASGGLAPGRFELPSFPGRISFEVPEGWETCGVSETEQSICKLSPGPTPAIGFSLVTNVVADPCDATARLLDPPVGPTVDDLVAAISGLKGFAATKPQDIRIDGVAGKLFTVTAPLAPFGCELRTWATRTRTNGMSSLETNVLRVIQADGQRILISLAYQSGEADVVASTQPILDSIRIGRP